MGGEGSTHFLKDENSSNNSNWSCILYIEHLYLCFKHSCLIRLDYHLNHQSTCSTLPRRYLIWDHPNHLNGAHPHYSNNDQIQTAMETNFNYFLTISHFPYLNVITWSFLKFAVSFCINTWSLTHLILGGRWKGGDWLISGPQPEKWWVYERLQKLHSNQLEKNDTNRYIAL